MNPEHVTTATPPTAPADSRLLDSHEAAAADSRPPALSPEAGRQCANAARDQELPTLVAGVPRLALRPDEAAAALGVSEDFFREHVLPELRTVRRGRLRLVAVAELERWMERSAARGEW